MEMNNIINNIKQIIDLLPYTTNKDKRFVVSSGVALEIEKQFSNYKSILNSKTIDNKYLCGKIESIKFYVDTISSYDDIEMYPYDL